MQDNNKQKNQTNFLLAAVLSLAVISIWGYFYAPNKSAEENANVDQANSEQANSNTESTPEVKKTPEPEKTEIVSTPDETENRTITIKTPLFKAKIDSKGAVATSWILFLNDADGEENKHPLYAQGATEDNKIPLELIPPKALEVNPVEAPFRLSTGNKKIDNYVNLRNYNVSESEAEIDLKGSETKKIEFTLKDSETGIEVVKSFVFKADSYIADVSVKLKKDGEAVPNTKLLIGASIGDQGIERYNFYHVESQGVAEINDDINRQYSASIADKKEDKGRVAIDGEVGWVGIADTYFAMIVIPSEKLPGLEYRSTSYDVETKPFYNGIIAWVTRKQSTKVTKHLMTAYVPIKADGAVNRLYTGTKDSFVLNNYGKKLTEIAGRKIDITETINFGWLRFFTKPLSYPVLVALKFLTGITHNYGISIIIFTFFFYSLLFPLRWYSSKSFKKAQKNAPKMKALQDKMKAMQKKGLPADDPAMRKLQMEQLKMTKDAVPIGGCLPMLLQFPFLITIYYTVSIALGFRQASFLWLADLSSADPYRILPIGFAISMVLTFMFSPTTPAVTSEQKMQQKLMSYIMPLMMLWIMWSAPAGLLLYWFTGNVIMFGQQMLINWMNKTDEDSANEGGGKDQQLATT